VIGRYRRRRCSEFVAGARSPSRRTGEQATPPIYEIDFSGFPRAANSSPTPQSGSRRATVPRHARGSVRESFLLTGVRRVACTAARSSC
jgi:hypothetical protein